MALSVAAAGAVATPRAIPEPTRFDLAVNHAPAAQVFMQIGSGTAYNMLVSPDVSGHVSITLKNTTVTEALESMRELFGYDFRITGNRIFVYPNTVQTKLYRINYLSGRRRGGFRHRACGSRHRGGHHAGWARGVGQPRGRGGCRCARGQQQPPRVATTKVARHR